MSTASRRRAPGSACQKCRLLKMRCIRTSPSSCERCSKTGRRCIVSDSPNLTSDAREASLPSPAPDMSHQSAPVLPSIFSTSPYANLVSQSGAEGSDQTEPAISSGHAVQRYQTAWKPDSITPDDTAQMIKFFKEKLLVTAPVLVPEDYTDAENLMEKHPNLVTCIVYVTSRYVPGYQELRESLMPSISLFLRSAVATNTATPEEEMANMQAFIILYIFSRSGAIEMSLRGTVATSDVNFWSIKASCEAYATHIRLHRAVDELHACWRSGTIPDRTDRRVRLYLFWLWLFTTCHNVSIVTGSPPTITIDSSIRAAPMLLKDLRSNNDIFLILAEVELCLLWYTLGRKDPRIAEWWSSKSTRDFLIHDSPRISFGDIDAALNDWWSKTMVDRPQGDSTENVMSLSPLYYFNYTRFCLNTHFVQHISSKNPGQHEVKAIRRCVDAARDVLTLARQVGPIKRDQLRYFPGFIFVTLTYCASFILKAIQGFPMILTDPEAELEMVRVTALFLMDLGSERSHGALAAGQTITRQHKQTINLLKQVSAAPALQGGQTETEMPGIDLDLLQDMFWPYAAADSGFPIWDFQFEWEPVI